MYIQSTPMDDVCACAAFQPAVIQRCNDARLHGTVLIKLMPARQSNPIAIAPILPVVW